MQHYDVIIAGAGAGGLFCAIEAGKRGRSVLVIEKSKKPAEKIRISGGGRCNFTNLHAAPENYLSHNPHFCKSALKRYSAQDFIRLVESHGIAYHEKTLGQLFCDGSSKEIIQMLLSECETAGVTLQLETEITELKPGYQITTSHGQSLQCESFVVATGGPSIPKMGATGWGYEIAGQFGLSLIPPRPALVPFTLEEEMLATLKPLAGVSLEAIASNHRTQFREGMLFTHRGLSGPSILQLSSYWQEGEAISLNLLPDQKLLDWLKTQRENHPKQEIRTALATLIPKRLADYLCEAQSLDRTLAETGNKALQKLADQLHQWQIMPGGTEGYRTAEVTLGGVDTDELSSQTMESKKHPGLFFIGEVVDVTGWLGGYNFQWAWSSGYAAGKVV
jgi:predicted Rossmann fold flavoprotein